MRTASVYIQIERTFEAAASALLPTLLERFDGEVVILPSSLEADDPVAETVSRHLPEAATPQIVTPMSGAAARRAFFMPTVLGDWRDVPVTVAGARVDSTLLPKTMPAACHRIISVDVVEVARHGPFVLDVMARYVHPRQRLRLVTDRARPELAAEVASAALPSLSVIRLSLPEGTLLAVSNDIIAAELVALALSERCIGSARSFTGPWEDAVVQRATELELGVLIPAGIRLQPTGTSAREAWADALIEHIRIRLGIPGTSSLRP